MTRASSDQRCPFEGATYPFERDRTRPLDPPGEFALLRAERPVFRASLWNGEKVWLVTRHADAQAVLNDPRFSSSAASPGYPTLSRTIAASRKADPTFLRMDPPKHTEHRRMWTPFFALVRVNDMRPGIQDIVDRTLTDFLSRPQPADFVEHFALVVPSLVICRLLDVSDDSHEFFKRHSKTRMAMHSSPEEILAAMKALDDFWDAEFEKRERNPGDDLVSRLIVSEVKTGRLTRRELVSMAQLMLLAGHETTANMITLGLILLLENPAQMQRLRNDRSLMPYAIDEMLRFATIAQHGLGRAATSDIEIGGQMIRAGEGVLVVVASADRDDDAFAEADLFDIARRQSRQGPGIALARKRRNSRASR